MGVLFPHRENETGHYRIWCKCPVGSIGRERKVDCRQSQGSIRSANGSTTYLATVLNDAPRKCLKLIAGRLLSLLRQQYSQSASYVFSFHLYNGNDQRRNNNGALAFTTFSSPNAFTQSPTIRLVTSNNVSDNNRSVAVSSSTDLTNARHRAFFAVTSSPCLVKLSIIVSYRFHCRWNQSTDRLGPSPRRFGSCSYRAITYNW